MPTRQTTTLNTTQFPVADGNWDVNRGPVTSIILHTIDGTIEGANAIFNTPHTPPNYGKSTHYGIGLDGKIYQWVDEDNVAYQAGNYAVNQTSIGIEHEDNGNYNDPRPNALYESSAKLIADICQFYDIPCDNEHIFRHSQVIDKTVYPGGTSCPDALDTDRLISTAYAILHPEPLPVDPVSSIQPQEQSTQTTSSVEQPVNPSLPEQPQVNEPNQNGSNPIQNPIQNTPDQTPTSPDKANLNVSSSSFGVLQLPKLKFLLLLQPFQKLVMVVVRLLIALHILEEVKA